MSAPACRVLCGNVEDVLRGLEPDSVQMVATSPPYWGLRDYGTGAWLGGDPACQHKGRQKPRSDTCGGNGPRYHATRGTQPSKAAAVVPVRDVCPCGARRVDHQVGLERTPEEYVARIVSVFREVRRVLRPDGVVWLNLGDCYATGAGSVGTSPGGGYHGERWLGEVTRHRDRKRRPHGPDAATRATRDGSHAGKHTAMAALGPMTQPNRMPIPGLKPKDLVGIPWRVAFALQADGWWLRRDVVWSKPNPMPESAEDRPTTAHEYVFLLSRSESYFYDAVAIEEPCRSGPSDVRKMREGLERIGGKHKTSEDPLARASSHTNMGRKRSVGNGETRNKRSVWEIATQPYPGAHFATWPEALVEPMVLAGTSARGACVECGAPWERVVSRTFIPYDEEPNPEAETGARGFTKRETTGWRPTCAHVDAATRPCLVLDLFAGSGTTGVCALRNGRHFLGVELSPAYAKMARHRIAGPLFAEPEADAV